jgi:hypothetical protein
MANGNKAPKGWLIAAFVFLLLGLGGCGLGAVSTAGFVDDVGDSIVSPTPYGEVVDFTGTGDDALIMASDGRADCTITDESGRSLRPSSLDTTTEVEAEGLVDVGTFDTVDGERYEVLCDGAAGGEFTVISIDLSTIGLMVGGLLGGGFFLFLAFVCFIIGLVRRSSWKKKQRTGGGNGGYTPPAPGGYAPPAPGGYGTPPAPGGYGTPPPPGGQQSQPGWGSPPAPGQQPPAPDQPGWGAPPAPGQQTPPDQGNWGAPPPPGRS